MFQFSSHPNSKLIYIIRPEHGGLEEYAELTRKTSDFGGMWPQRSRFGGEHNRDDEKMPQLLANDQKFGYRVQWVYNHETCEEASFVVHFLSTFLIHFTATFYPTAHQHQLSSRWAACSHSTYWPNWTKLLSFIQCKRAPTWFSLINSLLSAAGKVNLLSFRGGTTYYNKDWQ